MTMPELSFGQRLRLLRERAGKSRPVLGGLVGRSADWVKALENGRLLTPRMPLLIRLAEALGIDDLAELTGSRHVLVASATKAGVPGTEAVATALLRPFPSGRAHPPIPIGELRSRVDLAWALWHQSSAERSAIAAVLPDLVADARATVQAAAGVHRRHALADQARVYHLVQLLAAYQPAAELVWLAADRAMSSAQDADDPVAVAAAAWYYAHIFRTGGQPDAAVDVLSDAARALEPGFGVNDRALSGQLQLGLALAHAKAGRAGQALRYWDAASTAARELPAGYFHPWLLFGTAAVDAYRVTIEADLFHLGEASRLAEKIEYTALPSRTRRAAYLIEAARLMRMRNDYVGTVHMLERALRQSVDTVRHHPVARTAVLELVSRPGVIGEDAREVALAIGLEG